MSSRFETLRANRDVLRIPVIRVAFALSLVIHAAALLPWMKPLSFSPPPGEAETKASRFQARLAPAPIPAAPAESAPSRQTAPQRRPSVPAPVARATPPSPAPVIALNSPSPPMSSPVQPPPAPSPPAPSPPVRNPVPAGVGDMAALIEARRQARGDPAPPAPPRPQAAEDENQRLNRVVAENLGSQRARNFGPDPKGSGGVFQLEHLYYDSADFTFFGWNRDISRNTRQLIEVRKGDNSDIDIAVIRKIIEIIRDHERGDFQWYSKRIGKNLTLSARARDNAGLEELMLKEFDEDLHRYR